MVCGACLACLDDSLLYLPASSPLPSRRKILIQFIRLHSRNAHKVLRNVDKLLALNNQKLQRLLRKKWGSAPDLPGPDLPASDLSGVPAKDPIAILPLLPPKALARISRMLPFADACSLFLLSKGCHGHATAHMPQQCLILDIDGTLIGSIRHGSDAHQQAVDKLLRPDWVFCLHDWLRGNQFHSVYTRPHLKAFLEYAAQRFRRVAIWLVCLCAHLFMQMLCYISQCVSLRHE